MQTADILERNKPAGKWEEAFPIGNGRMGAMIFGQPGEEKLQLNEDSIWYGGPMDRINPDAKENLPKVRKLILEGKIPEAEELLRTAFSGNPQSQHPYQKAGDVEIRHMGLWKDWGFGGPKGPEEYTEYKRLLDMEKGLAEVSFSQDGVDYEREYLASYPAQVLAMRLRASRPGSISIRLLLTRDHLAEASGKEGSDTVWLSGSLGKTGSDYILAVKACAKGGVVRTVGETLEVDNADEVVLYFAQETSFYHGDAYRETAVKRLEAAAEKGYESIKAEHVADYQALYTRVSFHLEGEEAPETLLKAQQYFQFGRYLMIAGSRPGSQPETLQGIWNDQMQPAWDSKYTININTEMNYWPAEICNLSECHLPLFDLLKRMQPRGREVAQKMYGCRGMTAHHNTDLWGDCAPQDICISSTYWVMGAAWLSTHIMWHYRYTKDQAFLKEVFPVLEDAVVFFHDYLIMENGYAITCPTVSPENTYILPSGVQGRMCAGSAMDTGILRDLFTDYLEACQVLGKEETEEMVAKTKELLSKLQPLQIGKHGQIMEWPKDYEEAEPGHRHISQLYALHPSHQITVDGTPELAEAARKTLERRLSYGGGHTGWSCAWIVNFYSRLGDGEKAWENLKKLWEKSTFPNLMDNHPMGSGAVFQIDGNFGATAAIAEMLVQSNQERTLLLPALPCEWKNGSIRGLRIMGGASIDLAWKDGTLTKAVLYDACEELEVCLVYQGEKKTIPLKPGERKEW